MRQKCILQTYRSTKPTYGIWWPAIQRKFYQSWRNLQWRHVRRTVSNNSRAQISLISVCPSVRPVAIIAVATCFATHTYIQFLLNRPFLLSHSRGQVLRKRSYRTFEAGFYRSNDTPGAHSTVPNHCRNQSTDSNHQKSPASLNVFWGIS